MKAKARSLSAPQERKSKVALNCITWSDFIKDRVLHLPNSFNCRKGGNVNYGALTKQIQWLGYHRLLGSVFNHKEGSDCEHDLNLGPGADVRPPVVGDDVGHSRGGPSAPAGTVGCEVGHQSRAGGKNKVHRVWG